MPGIKRIFSKITEEDKLKVKEDGVHKWVWTNEKFNKYKLENQDKPDY
jgi:hypothetical protein